MCSESERVSSERLRKAQNELDVGSLDRVLRLVRSNTAIEASWQIDRAFICAARGQALLCGSVPVARQDFFADTARPYSGGTVSGTEAGIPESRCVTVQHRGPCAGTILIVSPCRHGFAVSADKLSLTKARNRIILTADARYNFHSAFSFLAIQ